MESEAKASVRSAPRIDEKKPAHARRFLERNRLPADGQPGTDESVDQARAALRRPLLA
jgi:hypothetical protein